MYAASAISHVECIYGYLRSPCRTILIVRRTHPPSVCNQAFHPHVICASSLPFFRPILLEARVQVQNVICMVSRSAVCLQYARSKSTLVSRFLNVLMSLGLTSCKSDGRLFQVAGPEKQKARPSSLVLLLGRR